MDRVKAECEKLEHDLNQALETSNRCIADRLRVHETKQALLQQLTEAMRAMTQLESQLKVLSASTLSMSSSSSLGKSKSSRTYKSRSSWVSQDAGSPYYSRILGKMKIRE